MGPVVNPANPGVNPVMFGAQPFVLGGAPGAGVGGRPDDGSQAQLAAAYSMILTGFAQLAQSGLLDEQGQEVFGQLAASYEAMINGQ